MPVSDTGDKQRDGGDGAFGGMIRSSIVAVIYGHFVPGCQLETERGFIWVRMSCGLSKTWALGDGLISD